MTDTPKTAEVRVRQLKIIVAELEADNERLAKLADSTIEANAAAHGAESRAERAEADNTRLTADRAAMRGTLAHLIEFADMTGQGCAKQQEDARAVLSADHPGDKLLAVVSAAQKWRRERMKGVEQAKLALVALEDTLAALPSANPDSGEDGSTKPMWFSNDGKPEEEWVCQGSRDGDCVWPKCPQIRDGEPKRSGRHCPLDNWPDEEVG